jgi:hypothetical protein
MTHRVPDSQRQSWSRLQIRRRSHPLPSLVPSPLAARPHTPPVYASPPLPTRGLGLRRRSPHFRSHRQQQASERHPLAPRPWRVGSTPLGRGPSPWCLVGPWGWRERGTWRWWRGRSLSRHPRGSSWWGTRSRRRRPRASSSPSSGD